MVAGLSGCHAVAAHGPLIESPTARSLTQVEQFEADIEAQQLKGGKGGKPFQ